MRYDSARAAALPLTAAVALSLLCGCSERDVERHIGAQAAAAIEGTYEVNTDPLLADYVANMGQIMVGHAERQGLPYEFRVINADLVNAFAAPYGHIYVTRGLLEFADSEDEVWAVVGHEIGHVVHRDAMKSLKESLLWQLGLMLLARNSKSIGKVGQLGFFFVSMRHSRRDELEADDMGVDLAFAAGYAPEASVVFFDRLRREIEKERPSKWEVYFQTHPDTAQRIERQSQRPPLATDNAEALIRVGRGYLNRGMYALALPKLEQAAKLSPQSAAARTALGECYATHGDVARAQAEFEAVLSLEPNNQAARAGLVALRRPVPAGPPAAPQFTQALVQRAEALAAQLSTVSTTVGRLAERLDQQLEPAATQTRCSVNSLTALEEHPGLGTEASLDLAATAERAATRANEVVYRLESLSAAMRDTVGRLSQTQEGAAQALSSQPDAQTAIILDRALSEAGLAGEDLLRAVATAPMLVKAASGTANVADNALGLVRRALAAPAPGPEWQVAQDAVAVTAARAGQAQEEVEELGAEVDLCRARALVAQINVAAALASPTLQRVYDRLVAHYTQTEAATVGELMEETGASYGEAALMLATATATRSEVDQVAERAGTAGAVAAAEAAAAPLRDINIVLTYLANAIQAEADFDAAGARPFDGAQGRPPDLPGPP